MVYPATTFEEAVDLTITAANQQYQIINGSATEQIQVEDSSYIPTVRKALIDNLYFKSPVAWSTGTNETVFNQLRSFPDPISGQISWWYAPNATNSNPILMPANPTTSTNWVVYGLTNTALYQVQKRLAAEAGFNLTGTFFLGCTLSNTTEVALDEFSGNYYSWSGVFPKVVSAGSAPTPLVSGGWIDRTDVLFRSELSGFDGANLVGGATYAQIRAYTGNATKIHCLGRVNVFDGASGDFTLDPSDTTSADDDGTVLIDANGGRWKRQISGDIIVKWWLDGTGPAHDCGIGFQKVINSYPRSRIQVPLDESGYYFDTQVVEPNSASFELVGTEGIQSSLQQVMYARTSGAVFYSPPGQTTFTRYRGFRFVSNKTSYPAARAIHIAGDWVHGEMKSVVAQNFNLNPLLVSGASNVCNYEHIMGMFNNSWALRVEQGAGNTFTRITGDNNDGPVLYAYGGSNTFTNLYSEDCCKRNVSNGETNPEFEFVGDTPVINGIILNSFAGNSTPPVKLSACRNMTLIGGANKSTTAPSYTYDINVTATDSSLTMINSSGLRTGNSDENVVIIDAGYTTARPSIKVGPHQRDIYTLCPVAQVCFNGTGTPTIHQGAWVSAVTRVAVGEYDIGFAEPIPFPNGIIVTGMADNDGGALNITVCEVLGARSTTKARVRVQRTDGVNVDVQFVSVVIHGITG